MAITINDVKTLQVRNAKNGDFDIALGDAPQAEPEDGVVQIQASVIQIRNAKNGDFDLVLNGGSSLPLQLELIGTWTGYLPELAVGVTESQEDTVNTEIDVANTSYLFVLITIECDGEITGATKEWGGFSMGLATRYRVGTMKLAGTVSTREVHSLVFDSQHEGVVESSYGIVLLNNWGTVGFKRKTYGPQNTSRIMGGNYTVRAYGVTGF